MYLSKRVAVTLLTMAALSGSAAAAMTAVADPAHGNGQGNENGQGNGNGNHADRGNRTVLSTPLAPSVPTDPTLFGAAAGGAPWVLSRGEAQLKSDGRLEVRIRGLVIPVAPFAGTTGPVTMVSASLYCGASTTPVGTSTSFPISTNGNARITANLTLPAKCEVPALLIHPNGADAVYIATSGF